MVAATAQRDSAAPLVENAARGRGGTGRRGGLKIRFRASGVPVRSRAALPRRGGSAGPPVPTLVVRDGQSPYRVIFWTAPTYTLPFTTSGTVNLTAGPAASPEFQLELYSSCDTFVASYACRTAGAPLA